jgi:hypothetical protein
MILLNCFKQNHEIINQLLKRNMAKRREIRNSTAEFLIFQIEGKE